MAALPRQYRAPQVCSGTSGLIDNGSCLPCQVNCPIPFLVPQLVGGSDSNGNYDSVFVGWSGCPDVVQPPTGDPNPPACQIAYCTSANVTATFEKDYGSPTPISVTLAGNGTGFVSSNDSQLSPSAISCGDGNYASYSPCSATVNSGSASNIDLQAFPGNCSSFAGWSGCPNAMGSNCYVPPGQSASLTATFTGASYTVTSSAGANGSVSPASATICSGSSFSLTITPSSGYHLSSLTDNGTDVTQAASWNGSYYTYVISSVTSNNTVQAAFAPGSPPPPASVPALSTPAAALLVLLMLGLSGIVWRGRNRGQNRRTITSRAKN